MRGTTTLGSRLKYDPRELQFGTSGRRGLVRDLTQLEIYANAVGELLYLQSLTHSAGGISQGDEFYFAYDLRPSSTSYVASEGGRGEICQAVQRAIVDCGMLPINLGQIPTPALGFYALSKQRAGIMITGSHIPFDRNGYKLYTSRGELMKADEQPIQAMVSRVRERLFEEEFAESAFDEYGAFKEGAQELVKEDTRGREAYLQRYIDVFSGYNLTSLRVVVYQHSAVGRDMLVELLEKVGVEVIAAGRSEVFVPVDTENIDDAQLETISTIVRKECGSGAIDAIVSTDGDSDRPMLLGWDPGTRKATFFPGDLLGMAAAQFLAADSVVVPITCNDAIDRGDLAHLTERKTRIGSPYVIEGMKAAETRGKRRVCGWEPNGGFLLGSDVMIQGKTLRALPTRDAVLPILSVLALASQTTGLVQNIFAKLPPRFGRSALLRPFPKAAGSRLVQHFSPRNAAVRDIRLDSPYHLTALDENGASVSLSSSDKRDIERINRDLERVFTEAIGFGPVAAMNYTDGVRLKFASGEVVHFRPSGNADELRIYAVADSQDRADEICRLGIKPDGILNRLECLPDAAASLQ